MFRALLAHPQEALHKRHLLYCVRIQVKAKVPLWGPFTALQPYRLIVL
jgi:hypothetical protein